MYKKLLRELQFKSFYSHIDQINYQSLKNDDGTVVLQINNLLAKNVY
jgi:hypothetical protein